MTFQGGFIRRRVLVGVVRAPVLAACGLTYAAGSTAATKGCDQKYNLRLNMLTAGQSWRPFEMASSCNRHGPAGRPAR